MTMNTIKKIIIFLNIFVFILPVWSQESDKYNINENRENYINFGFDKFIDIYNFRINANYLNNSDLGKFQLYQNYKGNALIGNNKLFQDEQDFGIKYGYPIFENLYLQLNQGWVFMANTRNKDLNRFSRLNGLLGLRYDTDDLFLEFLSGKEDNHQIGIFSDAMIYKLNARAENLDFDGYKIKTIFNSQLIDLNFDRKNTEIFNFGEVRNQFSEYDAFGLNYSYIHQDRFNLLLRNNSKDANLSDIGNYSLENRNRQKFDGNINFELNPVESLFASVRINYANESVTMQYREYLPGDAKTGVSRERNLNQLGITAEARYDAGNINQLIGMSFNLANEDNLITNRFSLSEDELFKIRNQYIVQNNNINENKLYLQTRWQLKRWDTLNFNFSISLRRYDTPSNEDNTDMDEFRLYGVLNYGRKFSSMMDAGMNFELQMNHQVYLKSQRSAGNNWLRIIKLSPYINYETKSFAIRPKFEGLANYTIYDFESVAPGVKSFSFRQIGYRDSLSIKMFKNNYLAAQVFYRYFEIGILNWREFAESPQKSNTELFSKLLWNYLLNENFMLFIGARLNNLNQSSLIKNAPSSSHYRQLSYGPEMMLKYKILNDSFITISGWYEFQFINQSNRVEFPNLFMTTNIKL